MNADTRMPWETFPYNTLSPDTIAILNGSLSKLGRSALKELYQSPQMQQKTLAANLHISPSSLSNLLNKLAAIEPQLLETTQTGRSKFFKLTNIAEEYVRQEILAKPSVIHPFPPQQQEDLRESTLHILTQFQAAAGRDWHIILDDMMIGSSPANENNITLLHELYENFLDNMKQLWMFKQLPAIQEIQDILGNSILVRRLETLFDGILESYRAMEPLFMLARQNQELAMQFIDYSFTEIRPHYFPPSACPISAQNRPIDGEQFIKIFYELTTMANEFKNFQGDKQKALEHWKDKYCSPSISLSYIAEKCYTIYVIEQRTA